MSLLMPTFLQQLARDDIETVLLCGCGGGFDFVHSMVLYPELRRLGKKVVIGSYSFGLPENINGEASIIFDHDGTIAKKVTAKSIPPDHYGPEVHVCSFLDQRYPDEAPHFAYAYYARAFSVTKLHAFYSQLIDEYQIDAIVLMDGGSDSLMVGDEEGLGDPVEDAISVATVAKLNRVKLRILISIGLGSDRYNHVSDAATLRAIAELTQSGGYLGAVSLEPDNFGLQFYRDCIEHIYANQSFRSVIAGMILSAAEGYFGSETVPSLLGSRLQPGTFFVWNLMAMLWAFDVTKVAERSSIVKWIADCPTQQMCHLTIYQKRAEMITRDIENLPRHEDMRYVPPDKR